MQPDQWHPESGGVPDAPKIPFCDLLTTEIGKKHEGFNSLKEHFYWKETAKYAHKIFVYVFLHFDL